MNIQQILSRVGNAESIPGFIEKVVLEELKIQYSELVSSNSTYLPVVLETIFKSKDGNNQGFVFIIDEWDCIFREAKDDIEAQKKYLDFLKDLFKDRTYVALAYMTGILPIRKYGTHSALNIFREYSMTDPAMDYYINAAKYVEGQLKDVEFYIFSNDILWVKENINFPMKVNYVEGENPSHEELALMTSCNHFIISNSTFSWWGQFLSNNENKIVIAPKNGL